MNKAVIKRIFIVLILFALGIAADKRQKKMDEVIPDIAQLQREAGEGTQEVTMDLTIPEVIQNKTYTFKIPEKELSSEEQEQRITNAKQEIQSTFLLENRSFEQIESRVLLKETYAGGMVKAAWSFEPMGLIGQTGEVIALLEKNESEEAMAKVYLSCEGEDEIYTFPITIRAVSELSSNHYIQKIQDEIERQASDQEPVHLPDKVLGKTLQWKSKRSYTILLPVLGALLFGFIEIEKKEIQKRVKKKKQQELNIAYAGFVSKLGLLLSAGMSITTAIGKINQSYQSKKMNGQPKLLVYEYLGEVQQEMNSGSTPVQALSQFAEKTQNQKYRVLTGLLIQQQLRGNPEFMQLLQYEVGQAFTERKQSARRAGEEAGTKLLGPMLFMLLLTLMVILVPALLSI
ncbi:MAG: hypothetical protein ACK5ML_07365 [Lachnospiraceae bacterium]